MKTHILVAEDNYINQKLIEKLFQLKGWDYTMVIDGADVIGKVKSGNFDLILMDISMPNMDGFEATQIIREFNKDIPVIATTANIIAGFRERCFACGMNDFISKPFRKNEIFEKIEKLISHC